MLGGLEGNNEDRSTCGERTWGQEREDSENN